MVEFTYQMDLDLLVNVIPDGHDSKIPCVCFFNFSSSLFWCHYKWVFQTLLEILGKKYHRIIQTECVPDACDYYHFVSEQ